MKNMLLNYDFRIPYNDEPMYYILEGDISYDNGPLPRTLSLTMRNGEACISYEPYIDIARARTVTLGFNVRAIEIKHASVEITFYDNKFVPLGCKELEFTHCIGHSFTNTANNFRNIDGACYCTVKITFKGKVTALTLHRPYFKKM
jgi:hypothetical protein